MRRSLIWAAAVVVAAVSGYLVYHAVLTGGQRLNLPELASAARPAVVMLSVYDSSGKLLKTGTGFFVSPDGKLITNWHVVEGATSVEAKLEDGAIYKIGGTLTSSADLDLALLKAEAKRVPFLKLETSRDIAVGTRIAVIGSPLGLEGTVSEGVISAVRSTKTKGSWLQMTAPVSPGSSGSPVFDAENKVIGVATMVLTGGEALNFAVPSDVVASLLEKAKGHDEPMPFSPPGGRPDVLPPDKTNVAELTSRAENGDPEACRSLAKFYLEENPVVAAMWGRKGADLGDHEAELLLGHMYFQGDGVPSNPDEGKKWILKAAIGGLSTAQLYLANESYVGERIPQNYGEAAKWASVAARQGHPLAHALLGQFYFDGRGVPQDWLLAYAWTNAAEPMLKGTPHESHAAALKTWLRKLLSTAEIEQAEALSTEISQGQFDQVDEVEGQVRERAAQKAKEQPLNEARERVRRFAPDGTVYNLKTITVVVGKKKVVVAPETELRLTRKNADGTVHVQTDNLEADVPSEDVTNDRDWMHAYRTLHAGEDR